MDSPGGLGVKDLPSIAGDTGDMSWIPGLERSPGKGNGNPLQYSFLEDPHGQRSLWATVQGVTKELNMP